MLWLSSDSDRGQTVRKGLVSRVAISCMVCGEQSFLTDPYHAENQIVNTKSILAMRTIGKGRVSPDTFTATIGMLFPVSKPSYSCHNKKIAAAMSLKREVQLSAAAAFLWKDATLDEIVDIRVTYDGTWSRRGHQAKYGVVVDSWENRLVLDTEVLSKFCYECHAKKNMDTDLMSSLSGGRNTRVIAARTTMGHQGVWRRREQGRWAAVYRKVQAPIHGGSC